MADVPAGKVPILESVGAAYRYLFDNWQMWLPAVVVLSALSAVIAVVNPAILIPKFEFISATQSLQSSIFISIASLIFTTGVLKHALHDEFQPPLGITFGKPELRVLGVTLGLILIFGIISIFVLFVFSIMLAGAAAQMGLDLEAADPVAMQEVFAKLMQDGGNIFIIAFAVVCFAAAIFVYIRLLFVQAATVAEGRMVVFSSWGLSQGNWWRILAAVLLVAIPVSIVSDILFSILEIGLLKNNAASVSSLNHGLFGFGVGLVTTYASVTMAGLIAYLYKGLQPREPVSSVFE